MVHYEFINFLTAVSGALAAARREDAHLRVDSIFGLPGISLEFFTLTTTAANE